MQKFKLKVITPLAITNGNKLLKNFDFFIDKNNINVINFDKLLSKLSEEKLYTITSYLETNPNELNLEQFISEPNEIIKYSIGYYNLLDNRPVNEITEHIKNYISHNGELVWGVYIPGSSIKGAIRTAILYSIIEKKQQEYQQFISGKNYKYKEVSRFESEMLDLNLNHRNLNHRIKSLSYLKVSDSNILDSSKVLFVKNVTLLFSSRKINEFMELIKENTEFEISISLDIDKLGSYLKQNNITNYDYQSITQEIRNYMESLYKFSKDLIEYEKNYFKSKHLNSVYIKYEKLEKLNTKETPLIRLGKNTGKLSKTFLLRNKDQKNILFPKTRRVVVEGREDYTPLGWIQLIPID